MKPHSVIFSLIFIFLALQLFAQPQGYTHDHDHSQCSDHTHAHAANDPVAPLTAGPQTDIQTGKQPAIFLENKGQWHENILYQTGFAGIFNGLYLEQNRLTYQLYDQEPLEDLHAYKDAEVRPTVMGHSYHVNFVNANAARTEAVGVRSERYNYFLGNDRAKWASNVRASDELFYRGLYENIDLRFYRKHEQMKYEFIVAPGAEPADIVLEYEGADKLEIVRGQLKVHTSVAIVTELQPYTYQIIDGKEIKIDSRYVLDGNRLTFDITENYNKNYPLVIDPTVVAATLSGHNVAGSAGVFGHTATFDTEGNIYAGGLAFGAGYATTTGAFDGTFNTGEDMVFSKYNPTGTDLIYATYVGGNNQDFPHSIVTDFGQNLYIYGSSFSANYPVTANAYQSDIGINPAILTSDIVLTVISADGSSLIGSTFVGGTGTDGQNTSELNANYGDRYRGEIVLDAQNNIYVASGTRSADFPIVNGFDDTFSNDGGVIQDGVVMKMSGDLSFMYWSTYLGGELPDFAMSLRLDDAGDVYVTGYAGSSDFPTTSGVISPNWPGGDENAFVAKISSDGTQLLSSTFWGSTGDEHGYFLEIDELNNIHIYGQSSGFMPITAGVYATEAGSPQFISSFTPDLATLNYSTVIGEGPGGAGNQFNTNHTDFIPVAFMVDKCNNIYFSGYGTSNNLPITSGAVWNNGDSFYLGVLTPDAEDLSFATYYGRSNHVDGGTSRFDKSGTVYQAVCSCTNGTNNAMVTNPDAFETDMPGATCDVGVFKIDFEVETVTAAGVIIDAGTGVVSASGCAPYAVDFQYTGQDATGFYWNFGDGDDSTLENPSHVYQEAGVYPVFLVVDNPFTCNEIDTVFLQVDVLDNQNISRDTSFCNGDNIILDASVANATYEWQDGFTGSTYQITEPGTYFVNIDIGNCARTDTFVVNEPLNIIADIGDEIIIACDQDTYTFDATGDNIASYLWNDNTTEPVRTVSTEGDYAITVTDANGCTDTDDAVLFFGDTPSVDLGPDALLCFGESFTVDATFSDPNVTYTWSDGSTDPVFTATEAGAYTVVLSDDGCLAEDEFVLEWHPEFILSSDIVPVACSDDCNASIAVSGSGGTGDLFYEWNTGSSELQLDSLCAGLYSVTVTDALDCEYVTDFDLINPEVLTFADAQQNLICAGDASGIISAVNVQGGIAPYSFSLNDGEYQDAATFENLDAGNYTLNLLDDVGCLVTTDITLTQPPEFFVDAGPDQTIELGETTTLDGDVFPLFGQDILWTPDTDLDCTNCFDPTLRPPTTVQYLLTATDTETGCEKVDSVIVEVIPIRKVYIPNAFSPDGDGVNDEFMIFGHIGVEEIEEFKVFDRWGERVFENGDFLPNKPGNGWDGTYRGQDMNTGVFAYIARVRYYDGVIGFFKGDVTRLR